MKLFSRLCAPKMGRSNFYFILSIAFSGSIFWPSVSYALGTATPFQPQNNIRVDNGRPCFSWIAASEAESYTIQVSSDTNFNQYSKRWVLNDVAGTSQCWGSSFIANPTAAETPYSLYAGNTYYWRIRSDKSGTPSTFSSYNYFRVPNQNAKPTINPTFPNVNQHYNSTVSVVALATASDSDGSIASVEFKLNNGPWSADTSSPYAENYGPLSGGSYTMYFRAKDNSGEYSPTVSRAFTVNTKPVVGISSPAVNTTYITSESVTTTAYGQDSDGTVVSMEFKLNNGGWSVDTSPPYSKDFGNLPAGDHSIYYRAKDNNGVYSSTVTRSIKVMGVANLSSPSNNATITNGIPCFSWQPAVGASYYTVQVSSDTNFDQNSKRWVLADLTSISACWSQAFVANPTAQTTPSKLESDNTYYWRIKSMNAQTSNYHKSSFTSHRSFAVPVGVPARVTGVSGPNNADVNTTFNISWDSVGSATHYNLIKYTGDTEVEMQRYANITGTQRTVSHSSEEVLVFRVEACNTSGCGPTSGARIVSIVDPNTPATVNAGNDITKPEWTNLILTGTAADDSGISSMRWDYVSGPRPWKSSSDRTDWSSTSGGALAIFIQKVESDTQLILRFTAIANDGEVASDDIAIDVYDRPDGDVVLPANWSKLASDAILHVEFDNLRDSSDTVTRAQSRLRKHQDGVWTWISSFVEMDFDASSMSATKNYGSVSALGFIPNVRYLAYARALDDSGINGGIGYGWYKSSNFYVNDKPVINGSSSISGVVGSPIPIETSALDIVDSDDSNHTVEIQNGSNYSINGSSITFNAGTLAGSYPVDIKVNDGTEVSNAYQILIEVTEVSLQRKVIFIHTDLLGSPIAETDESGDSL